MLRELFQKLGSKLILKIIVSVVKLFDVIINVLLKLVELSLFFIGFAFSRLDHPVKNSYFSIYDLIFFPQL